MNHEEQDDGTTVYICEGPHRWEEWHFSPNKIVMFRFCLDCLEQEMVHLKPELCSCLKNGKIDEGGNL